MLDQKNYSQPFTKRHSPYGWFRVGEKMRKTGRLAHVRRNIPSERSAPDLTLVRDESDPGERHSPELPLPACLRRDVAGICQKGESDPMSLFGVNITKTYSLQRQDGLFDGYRMKTFRPENGPWKMTTKS